MAAAPKIDPKLLGYGDTFGTYAGRNLGDTDIYSTAIDTTKLNISTFEDRKSTRLNLVTSRSRMPSSAWKKKKINKKKKKTISIKLTTHRSKAHDKSIIYV